MKHGAMERPERVTRGTDWVQTGLRGSKKEQD